MSSRILVAIRVAATPEHAFDVFTSRIGAWWRGNGLFRFTRSASGVISFEPGIDGRLIEVQPDGGIFEIGKITAWEPGARLAFSWRQESFAPDQLTRVEVRFEAVEDQTRVTVEHHGWDTVPAEHIARHGFPDTVFMRRHAEWWQTLLDSYRSKI
jgi:uncharacterized protein YndB with AHSA1/START domain